MAAYWRRVRTFSPSLRRMYLAAACLLFVWSGLMAVLYNLYLLRLGFDAPTIGLLGGLGALVWGLAALPAGLLSNRIGLRTSLQLGGALYGLGIALTLLVERLPPGQWQAWLITSGAVMNVGIAFAMVNGAPYIMAVTNAYERPHAFAFMAALGPLAAFAGSLAAGTLPSLLAQRLELRLDQPDPYRLAMMAGPLVCWLGMIPMLRADPGRSTEREAATRASRADAGGGGSGSGSGGDVATRAPLRLLAFWTIVVFLAALGEGSVRMFFNVLMDTGLHVAIPTIALVMGAAQLLPIAVALALPLLLLRWGAGHTLLGGIVALAVCLVPLAFGAANAYAGLISAVYLALVAAATVLGAARDLFGQEIVILRWRTSSQAAAMLGLALGLSAAGVLGGRLIAAWGFGTLYLIGALAAFVASLLLRGLLRLAETKADPGSVSPKPSADMSVSVR